MSVQQSTPEFNDGDLDRAQPKLKLSFPDVVVFDGETYLFVWHDEEQLHAFYNEGYPEEDITGVYTHIERGADDVLKLEHRTALVYAESHWHFQQRKTVE